MRAIVTYLMTSRLRDWLMMAPVVAVALALAMIGYTVDCTDKCPATLWQALGRSLLLLLPFGRTQLPSQSPLELVIAPYLILSGIALLISARLALRNLRSEMRVVWAHRLRGHVIVCGLGDTGRQVIENLRAAGEAVVVITQNAEDKNVADCEQLGIPVVKGDARQLSLLTLAGLPLARQLIATCGADAVNIEIALRARDALADKARPGGFQVLPEMRSQWLLETVWLHQSAALGSESVEFRPFNLYLGAVRDVLRCPGFVRAVHNANEVRPRLVLAGFGETNTQLVLHAVQNLFAIPGRRFCAAIFDDKGDKKLPALEARFPGLKQLADLDFIACTFDTEDPAAWSAVDRSLSGMLEDPSALLVVVALSDDEISLHAALQFRQRLDRLGAAAAPVFVRLRDDSRLGHFMASLDGSDVLVARLMPFGDLAALTKPRALFDSRADALAQALHAAYLEAADDPGHAPAAVPWARLAECFKHSNRLWAEHLPIALRRLGIRLVEGETSSPRLGEDEIEALAAMEHWRWSTERQLLGWTHGDPRDDAARQHPLLRAWSDLDEADRERNRRLARAVPGIAAAAGMGLRRERFIDLSAPDCRAAAAEIAALQPNQQGILLLDPQNLEAWAMARRAVEQHAAKIWVVWRAGAPLPAFPNRLDGKEVLRPAVESWITERQCAALSGCERRDLGVGCAAGAAAREPVA